VSGTKQFTVEVTSGDGQKATQALSVLVSGPLPKVMVIVDGQGQSGTVGAALPIALSVRLVDAVGDAVIGVVVSFVVTQGNGSIADSVVTDSLGIAAASYTLGTVAGAGHTVTATVGALSQVFMATATAGPAAQLVHVSGSGQAGLPTTRLPQPLVVAVQDVYGNAIPSHVVSFGTPTTGMLSSVDGLTDMGGQANATWTLGLELDSQSVRVTAAGVQGALTFDAVSGTSGVTIAQIRDVIERYPPPAADDAPVPGSTLSLRAMAIKAFDEIQVRDSARTMPSVIKYYTSTRTIGTRG
jgi:adhesin/invasin